MDIMKKQPLGIELVRRGIITGKDIEEALKYQKEHPNKKLGDILYILKTANPDVLVKNIGEIIGVKGIYLTDDVMNIEPTEYIPLDMMRNYKAIPFEINSGKIKIAFNKLYLNTT